MPRVGSGLRSFEKQAADVSTFAYTAIEAATGRECSGLIDSSSAEDATDALKARGLAPVSLAAQVAMPLRGSAAMKSGSRTAMPARLHTGSAESGMSAAAPRRRRFDVVLGSAIGTKRLAQFTRQLATLVGAGVSLVRALEVLGRQEKTRGFRAIVEGLAETIRSGGNFSEGLVQHPRTFDRLYVNMVKAGEAGGVLETVLERLARFMEKAERIRGRIVAALTYPLIVMLLAGGIVAALTVFVVPRFEQIFAGMLKGQPLPALTRFVLAASRLMQDHLFLSLALVGAGCVGIAVWRRTRAGSRALDWAVLRVPVLGDLFLKVAVARFTRTFGTLLASGVPILQALLITRETSGNAVVADAIATVHDRVKAGDDVAGPLSATGVFPAMVASMIEVGEETGALPEMLARIADAYEEDVDNAVTSLTSIIEPLMIVFLAVVVGTIVIALFLPIVSIIQYLQ